MSLQPYLDEYELLTPEERYYVLNGCGPKLGKFGELVPDFCGLYTPACDIHDWIYWCGGPKAIRKIADKKLKKDIERVNHRLPWYKRISLSWTPRVYYLAVRWFGESSFYRAPYRRTREDLQREMRDATL
jgi:hypothetical protein